MTREIKFRAWAHASKVMFYPDVEGGWELRNGALIPLPNTTLMQFTGLHDKNEKEIYEGDVVIGREATGEVEWHVDGWRIFQNKGYKEQGLCDWGTPDLEVIGNIYENPDLLTT